MADRESEEDNPKDRCPSKVSRIVTVVDEIDKILEEEKLDLNMRLSAMKLHLDDLQMELACIKKKSDSRYSKIREKLGHIRYQAAEDDY